MFFGVIRRAVLPRQNSVWVYPTGLISTGIYAYMLAQVHLNYMRKPALNAYYFIMSVYGWYNWSRNTDPPATVTDISVLIKQP